MGYFSSVRTEVILCSSSSSSSSTLRLHIGKSSFDFVFEEELVAGIALDLAFRAAGILPLAGSLAFWYGCVPGRDYDPLPGGDNLAGCFALSLFSVGLI